MNYQLETYLRNIFTIPFSYGVSQVHAYTFHSTALLNLNPCISVTMGFPTFYLSDLILIDASHEDYQCKVNWSPWTRTRISKQFNNQFVIHKTKSA